MLSSGKPLTTTPRPKGRGFIFNKNIWLSAAARGPASLCINTRVDNDHC